MIGYYDYTVILTYISLILSGSGIILALGGTGHPYLATVFLLACGLCDCFDGIVARTKKNRTETERRFGIQIDSLCDLVAFGVLPACIGVSLIRKSSLFESVSREGKWWIAFGFYAVFVLYILAALIRLAYYNVTEEIRQENEDGVREYYEGLPVTMSSATLPIIVALNHYLPFDFAIGYVVATLIIGVCFISKFKIKKPHGKGIIALVLVGVLEAALVISVFIK